jgi:FixJ family two-component response regulator
MDARLSEDLYADDDRDGCVDLPAVHEVVYVVDDDISVRESLDALIAFTGWEPRTFGTAAEFLAAPRATGPSCLVLDVGLPDLNGLVLQQHIAIDREDMPILFITGHGDIPTTVRAMKAGAVEFLTKPLADDLLLEAIRAALARSRATLEQSTELRTLRARYATLSGRERQVMTLVVAGRLNKQVGAELGISEITVKAHRGRMMEKMEARSFADLVRMTATLGLDLPPPAAAAASRSGT